MAALDELQARLEKQLFSEGITDLNAGSFRIRCFREILRRKRSAVNSIASGAGTDGNYRIAHPLSLCAYQIPLVHQPDTHRVHERISLVCGVEHDLSGHCRYAYTVAVIADPLDD